MWIGGRRVANLCSVHRVQVEEDLADVIKMFPGLVEFRDVNAGQTSEAVVHYERKAATIQEPLPWRSNER